MPKASKCAQHTFEPVPSEEFSEQEETSSDEEVFFNPQPSISKKAQEMSNMYIPYIEGPSMEWTVNDNLYNGFLKWKLKCDNILECELAMLSEERKCKKIVAWSGDFGLDHQAIELRARFDLLTSFKQADMSVDEWYNAVQTQVSLCKYPQETAQILQRDIFWFFLKDESFVSKNLNEGHDELNKFPASTVCQLAKKMESSQVTAKHMKHVTRDPQATQIDLLRHQRTELPPHKSQRKQRKSFTSKQANHKYQQEDKQDERSSQNHRRFNQEDKCSKCGDTPHLEGFRCPASRHQCQYCYKFGHFSHLCFKKKQEAGHKRSSRQPKAHQLRVGKYSAESPIDNQTDTSFTSSEDSFYLQMKVKNKQAEDNHSEVQHLVTNLEYKLKPHRRRFKFLRARIDTWSNVYVMPVSVYPVMYKDPDCTKLAPSKKNGIYTYTTVKIQ